MKKNPGRATLFEVFPNILGVWLRDRAAGYSAGVVKKKALSHTRGF
jgi:hypothetical protein